MLLTKTLFNKQNIIYIAILILLIIVIYIGSIFLNYYNYLVYEIVGSKIENRTIEVDGDTKYLSKELEHNQEIELVYNVFDLKGKINNKNIEIKSFYELNVREENQKIIINSKFAKENNHDLNDNIIINSNGINIELELSNYTEHNYYFVYIEQSLIEEIAAESNLTPKSCIIVIKKYKDVEKYLIELNSQGYTAYLKNSKGEQELRDLIKTKKISNICIYILIFIIIVLFALIFTNIDMEELEYYHLLKIIGFKDNYLIMINSTKKIIFSLISLFIATILVYSTTHIIEPSLLNINKEWLNTQNQILPATTILFTTLVLIIISFVSTLYNIKKDRLIRIN